MEKKKLKLRNPLTKQDFENLIDSMREKDSHRGLLSTISDLLEKHASAKDVEDLKEAAEEVLEEIVDELADELEACEEDADEEEQDEEEELVMDIQPSESMPMSTVRRRLKLDPAAAAKYCGCGSGNKGSYNMNKACNCGGSNCNCGNKGMDSMNKTCNCGGRNCNCGNKGTDSMNKTCNCGGSNCNCGNKGSDNMNKTCNCGGSNCKCGNKGTRTNKSCNCGGSNCNCGNKGTSMNKTCNCGGRNCNCGSRSCHCGKKDCMCGNQQHGQSHGYQSGGCGGQTPHGSGQRQGHSTGHSPCCGQQLSLGIGHPCQPFLFRPNHILSSHHCCIPTHIPRFNCDHRIQLRLGGLTGNLNFQFFRAKGCRVKIEFVCLPIEHGGANEHIEGKICGAGTDYVDLLKDDKTVVTILQERIIKVEWLDKKCNPYGGQPDDEDDLED